VSGDVGFGSAGDGSGAGSSFAHLAEDQDSSTIVGDWSIYAASGGAAFSGAYIGLTPDGALDAVVAAATDHIFDAGVVGDAASRFFSQGDGSFHWGDGTTLPSIKLAFNELWGGLYLLDDSSTGLVVGDPAGRSTVLNENGLSFTLDDALGESNQPFYWSVEGEANPRLAISKSGALHWGDGATATDVSLWRGLADTTPFQALNSALYVTPSAAAGAADPTLAGPYVAIFSDGSLFSEDDSTGEYAGLTPDGQVQLTHFINLQQKIADPTAQAGAALVYLRDNGAGKGQVCARFPTGAVQVLAMEP
jgi:hypothetical protein